MSQNGPVWSIDPIQGPHSGSRMGSIARRGSTRPRTHPLFAQLTFAGPGTTPHAGRYTTYRARFRFFAFGGLGTLTLPAEIGVPASPPEDCGVSVTV
jgi:hypothetical protein